METQTTHKFKVTYTIKGLNIVFEHKCYTMGSALKWKRTYEKKVTNLNNIKITNL